MNDKNKINEMGIVSGTKLPDLDPPLSTVGVIGWLRSNLFSGPLNTILTLAAIALLTMVIPPILNWTIFDAVWTGGSDACRGNPNAACWTKL